MQGKRAMLLASVGALAVLMSGVPAAAQSARVAVWADSSGFDDYDWIDRADAISEAIGEAPPDTSFAFEQGEPWAWTLEDGTMLIVEQLPDGPHGYYFEPGTDAPFLVRDPQTSFGFIDGAVAEVYGADGGVMSRDEGRGWLGAAMRGFERGKRLKKAMVQRDRWRNINVNNWYSMSYLLFDWWDDWDYGLRRYPAWRRHHDGPRGTAHRRHWEHERQRRDVAREIFQRWGQGGYRGRPPGRFTPPKAGTPPPPHRWDGHGRDGRDGRGEHRPRTGRDPRVEGELQTDMSVNPAQGGVRGSGYGRPESGAVRPIPGAGRPGGRPRPQPQAQLPAVTPSPAPAPAPAAVVEPPSAPPVVERPLPRVRPERGGDGPARMPRPRPEATPQTSDDDAPRPYSAPRPVRTERPAYTPPAPQSFSRPERTYTPAPAPAPTRSYTPAPSPAPSRSYTPAPSPAPSRSYSSPAPAPSRSTPSPAPAPAPTRSDPPAVKSHND